MTPIGLERSSQSGELGPTYCREVIATSRSALARISTGLATWSNGSSIRSNNVGGSRHATTSSRPAMILSAILSARSDEIPTLDVRPVCRGIASQSTDPLEAGLQSSFEQCLQSALPPPLRACVHFSNRPVQVKRFSGCKQARNSIPPCSSASIREPLGAAVFSRQSNRGTFPRLIYGQAARIGTITVSAAPSSRADT
jgi:hypothetical protein